MKDINEMFNDTINAIKCILMGMLVLLTIPIRFTAWIIYMILNLLGFGDSE